MVGQFFDLFSCDAEKHKRDHGDFIFDTNRKEPPLESKMLLCFNALENDQKVTLKFTSEKVSGLY